MPADCYARFCADLSNRELPREVLQAARRCLVDWYGVALPGALEEPAILLRKCLSEERGAARLLPDGSPAGVRAAALINGSAAHTLEFDDIYSPGLYHPGAPVIGAALAVAEARRSSGADLLRAIVAGYEISNRIAAAVNPAHYRYWHTTATVGCLGAAAASASVLGLDARRIGDAINLAATQAAGLQQAFRSASMAKPLHAGRAAESGVLCALAAQAGVTGAAAMLEGESGFGAAMSAAVDWKAAVAGLGEDYTICRMTQKNHGCCGHTFAALDAIVHLRDQHGIQADQVARIAIGSYGTALEVCGNREPGNAAEARFSLAWCAAVALHEGQVRLAAFNDAHLQDPALRATLARVELYQDAQAEQLFPDKRAARVVIDTQDGSRHEHFIPSRKGDPDWPLSVADLNAKFLELTAPVCAGNRARALLDRLWTIDALESVLDIPAPAGGPEGS